MKRKNTGWIVIHMAHSRAAAEAIEQHLTSEGYWVRLRPVKSSKEEEMLFEILTLPSEAREAQQLILQLRL